MKTMALRDAKAGFSAVVQAAEGGESTTITKHGKPVARVVPIEQPMSQQPERAKNFVEHLMAFPGGIEFERDRTPMRDVDL